MHDDLLPLESGIEVRNDTHLPRLADPQRLWRCPVLAAGAERALLELLRGRRLELRARGARALRACRRNRDAPSRQRVDARQVAEHRTHPALVRREDTRQEREQPDSPHVQHDAEEARSRESVRRRIDRDDPQVHAGGQQRDRHGGPAAASKGDRDREQVQREDVR